MSPQESRAPWIWPAFLLTMALNLFFVSELTVFYKATSRLADQRVALSKRAEQAQAQLGAARTWETTLRGLCADILEWAKQDADARKLADKYQIRRVGETSSDGPGSQK